MAVEIKLTQDRVSLVDSVDLPAVALHKWHYEGRYAATRINGKKQYLHRMIIAGRPGELVDHINGDTLDNRRSNLRVADKRINSYNSRLRSDNTSGMRWLGFDSQRDKWRVQVALPTGKKIMKRFKDKSEALKLIEEIKNEFSSFALQW